MTTPEFRTREEFDPMTVARVLAEVRSQWGNSPTVDRFADRLLEKLSEQKGVNPNGLRTTYRVRRKYLERTS